MIEGSQQFNASFHQSHRDAILSKMNDDEVIIVIGGKEHTRNSDVMFPFRQGSYMYYFTGFEEPDSVAILEKKQFILIVPPKDKSKEIWNGRRAGVEGAIEKYKATSAYNAELLETVVRKVCQTAEKVFIVEESSNSELTDKVIKIASESLAEVCSSNSINIFNPTVNQLRMVKSKEEIRRLKAANDISCAGHVAAIRACKRTHGTINENTIRAELEYVFSKGGASRLGYPSIVAAGVNATILHYPEANADAKPGDLVLIDAGAEYGYYTADVTRTWPLSGSFTDEQKAIYQIVYDAQEACFEALKPGITIAQLHKISEQVIVQGLIKLGIMVGDEIELLEAGKVKQFYPHTIGHYLGLDVHDVSTKEWSKGGKEIPLLPGMVITVEPGIYIQEDDETVDQKWRGIGIRIEDNLLITDSGSMNLTTAPRSIEDIEQLMAAVDV